MAQKIPQKNYLVGLHTKYWMFTIFKFKTVKFDFINTLIMTIQSKINKIHGNNNINYLYFPNVNLPKRMFYYLFNTQV